MVTRWGARTAVAWLLAALACAGSPDVSSTPTPAPTVSGPTATAPYFPPDAVWYSDVSSAALDPESPAVVAYLDRVGWGLGRMQVDFSIEVLEAPAGTALRPFTPTEDHFSPDCDLDPVPVPAGGALEGEQGYECRGNGDCHLIVADRARMRLFEMWRADIRGDVFRGGCLAVWDMTRVYPPTGRGEQCTSADAAGYPIAPLLFDADEVAAGRIDHAIRFILPNARIRAGEYVHPATHGTRAASGPRDAPPYGARLRLRADYPLASLPTEGARTVARAMQRHGMLLADGGQVALTARSDRSTRAKWAGLLGPLDLAAIRPRDFEMIAAGARIPLTNACVRN
jgi:serine/threonine-protein kinase